MKRIIEEKSGDGFEELLDEQVQIWCMNYIYTGKLIGVSDTCVCLGDPQIVYDTGRLDKQGFADAQSMGTPEHFVRMSAIESFGPVL